MQLIVFGLIVGLIIFIIINLNSRPSNGHKLRQLDNNDNSKQRLLFVAKGKLFFRNSSGNIQHIHSPYVQEMIDRKERSNQLHGWKSDTSLSTSFVGRNQGNSDEQLELQVIATQFISPNKLIYFLKDANVGGLFEYDLENNTERRLLHKQNLCYEDLDFNPLNNKILCSHHHNSGVANIALVDHEGTGYQQLTEGDTIDAAPAWLTGDSNSILYQSAGIARSEDGYFIAQGPTALKLLDLSNNKVTTVLENDHLDYLQPKVDSGGNLYFIRRPYEAPAYSTSNFVSDFIIFPFRLLRAVFHYLNFFSLMYSSKPLTSASGPQLKAELKDILIKGKRINAEKALRSESRVFGIPSLVPRSWQLVKRSHDGSETVLAGNVAAFDIGSDDSIVYTNGYAVFQLNSSAEGASVIFRDKLIANIYTP